MVANSQIGLQQLVDNLNKVSREFGMKINVKKTKVMCINHKENNKLEIYVGDADHYSLHKFPVTAVTEATLPYPLNLDTHQASELSQILSSLSLQTRISGSHFLFPIFIQDSNKTWNNTRTCLARLPLLSIIQGTNDVNKM